MRQIKPLYVRVPLMVCHRMPGRGMFPYSMEVHTAVYSRIIHNTKQTFMHSLFEHADAFKGPMANGNVG